MKDVKSAYPNAPRLRSRAQPFVDLQQAFALLPVKTRLRTHMPHEYLRLLPDAYRPLLNKFYRAHRSHMRAPPGADCWVAGNAEIVAALCLNSIENGYWLTGLLVAPQQRKKGLGAQLVTRALSDSCGPVWLFCAPELIAFYQKLGFSESTRLPETLAARLQRYNRHKTLAALCHDDER